MTPFSNTRLPNVFTPDDLMNRTRESRSLLLEFQHITAGHQNVVIYDDDHYYIGGVLAELLAANGFNVSLITPAPLVSYWSQFTLEQERIQSKLVKLGVKLYPQTVLREIESDCVRLQNTVSGNIVGSACDGVILVTDRISNDSLYYELKPSLEEGKLKSLRAIGDAEAPNIIAQAVVFDAGGAVVFVDGHGGNIGD